MEYLFVVFSKGSYGKWFLHFGVAVLVCIFIRSTSAKDILVEIPQGTLSGEIVKVVTNDSEYYSFKGIPYAKPPVGDLRFMAPEDPGPWEGIRDATKHGAVCPQVSPFTNEYIPGSEDCLFLNVYTPNLAPDADLPVLVSIPGGAYKYGSGDVDIYGPDFLVSKDVVLVTVNYRLGSLGFLSAGSCDLPGNAGLKDQNAALKWVNKNIKYFGGNRRSVTVIGESVGASSINYLMVSPKSRGLFHRAITMSGSLLTDWNSNFQSERRAFVLGEKLGLETNNVTELVAFLKNVTYDKLINNTYNILASEVKTNVLFKMEQLTPVIEKDCGPDSYITQDPMLLLDAGQVNKVDVMFSYNGQEALYGLSFYVDFLLERYKRYPELFVPSKIFYNSTAYQTLKFADEIKNYFFGNKTVSLENFVEFMNYANSASFVYGTQKFSRKWPHKSYFFKFNSYSSRNYFGLKGAPYGIIGASHFDDIYYIYDPKGLNMTLNMNSTEYKMIQHITTAITNFVKFGDPTPDMSLGVKWPEFNTRTLPYVTFAENLTVDFAADEDTYQFWDSIYEQAGMPL